MQLYVCALTILLSLSTLPFSAHAQSATRSVTLSEVIRAARENPPAIQLALATLQRVQAQEQYARGAYIPRFVIEGGSGISYNHVPYLPLSTRERLKMLSAAQREELGLPDTVESTAQNTYGRATLDYPLLDLSRHHAVKSAKLNTTAQRSGYGAAQRSATQDASELYLRGVAALALVEDAELTLARRSSQLGAIRELVKAGLRPSVDATRAEIEQTAARFALETRQIEVSAAGAALAAAIGADPTRPVAPAGFDDRQLPAALEPLPASVLAIARRPEIAQLEATLAARRAEHRAAIGARLPTAGVIGQGNVSFVNIYEGDGLPGRSLAGSASLYMRWSALDPAVWRRANVTRSNVEEAQRQLERALLAVRAEVVDAAYQVQRTRALLEQASQVLAGAEAARTAQNERYRAGVASLLDLLDAEGLEQNARRARIEAARDQRVARVRLLAACGEIDTLGR
jgi:outer membrane protein